MDDAPLRLIIRLLVQHGVDGVMIGNMAARLQGADLPTEDADMACRRGAENRERIMSALQALDARVRLAPGVPGGRFPTRNPDLLTAQDIWNLTTVYGDLDLLYAPAGRSYEELVEDAAWIDVGEGWMVLTASLDDIILSKELTDRPKDRLSLPELRRLREQQKHNRGKPGLSSDP